MPLGAPRLNRYVLSLDMAGCVMSFAERFFFTDTTPTEVYTLSLHDALPISFFPGDPTITAASIDPVALKLLNFRSEEHTSELQSRRDLVCRLLLEKKKNIHSPVPQAGNADEEDRSGRLFHRPSDNDQDVVLQ